MIKKIIFFLLLAFPLISNADRIRVNIFNGYNLSSISFIPVSNNYEIFSDSTKIFELTKNDSLNISVENKLMKLSLKGKTIGSFEKIYLKKKGFMNSFKIKSSRNKENIYDDDLELKILENKYLQLINNVDINYYVSGVIEAEGGKKANQEFYKVQAILCRTFALGNYRRHEKERFNLCDNVHCQVYRGRCKQSNILMAAMSTKGMIVTDNSGEPIIAPYHSNCGGQTVNSEDIWSKKISYLRSVTDTFCLSSRNTTWTKKIPVQEWEKYLKKKYNLNLKDSIQGNDTIYNFYQAQRKVYLYNKPSINLRDIRNDWNLKSTFFTIKQDGKDLILTGRGYGHGIGLCQEGAMRMSEKGFSFRDIINHYFTGVKIVYQDIPN